MNALGASILCVLIAVVLLGPRRWALLGMMAGVLYLTQGEEIQVFGLHLFAMRFLEMAGFIRVMARREFSFSSLNEIDRAFLWLYCFTTVVFLLRSTEGQAYQIGMAVDAILCYFTFRGLIQNIEDFKWFLSAFVILLSPYFLLVLMQAFTARNPFAIVGGPQGFMFRHGRPRCMGSFRHPDLFGSLGATFLPLFIGYALAGTKRFRALLGMVFCLGIVLLANSGGPVAAAAFGLAGWLFWRFRTKMSLVRRSIVGSIALLAVVMKAPIWYLPAKISSITGGGGWHRSYLMDIAFKNLSKWWLAGMPIAMTKNWFPYRLRVTGGADITNQYISFGLSAGIGSMFLLIFLLIRSFQGLGKTLSVVRLHFPETSQSEYLLWGLGVMLSVHIVNWINVSYFDQFYVIWFMQLAVISSVTNGANIAVETNQSRAQRMELQTQ